MQDCRLDKWLWCVRVFKTRAEATSACRGNSVQVNGLDAKPGRDIHAGEIVTVRVGIVTRTLKVIAQPKARVAELYRSSFDRYERSLPDASAFRDEAAAESWRKTRAASRHLADHVQDAPAIVFFLQPIIPWTPSDEEGPMDIGRLDASVYPAVQNFCVAARALGIGTSLTTVIRIHAAETLEVLGVPADDDGRPRYEIAACIPMGRPAGRFGVAPRKPASAVTHWNTFGNRRR